jgi:hypothetical protein
MASLKKLDVMIRQNSTVTQDYAIQWTKNWLNFRQEDKSNKDENGNYIYDYFADLFDSRDNSSWKIFSDIAAKNRDVKNTWVTQDGKEIKGVIYTFSKSIVIDMVSPLIPKYEIYNVQMNENPYTYNGDYKFIIAETDNELAELRVQDNQIFAYDAGAFAETKQLLDIENNIVNLKLIVFK